MVVLSSTASILKDSDIAGPDSIQSTLSIITRRFPRLSVIVALSCRVAKLCEQFLYDLDRQFPGSLPG